MDFNNLSVSSLQSNSCNIETNSNKEEVEVRWDPKIGPVSCRVMLRAKYNIMLI